MTINLRYSTSVAFVFTDTDYPERILTINKPAAPLSTTGNLGTPLEPRVIDVTQYTPTTAFSFGIPPLITAGTRWVISTLGLPDTTGVITNGDVAAGYVDTELPLSQGYDYIIDVFFEIPSPFDENILLKGTVAIFEIIVDGPPE